MSDPSDPKWATDIANKKPFLTFAPNSEWLSDSGSATTSTSTTGAKRDTIFGHTNRIHIWTPGTFTGAISTAKNALSLVMGDFLGLFVGGKNETIHNCDSRKIFGSKKRIRVGYKYKIPMLNIFPLGRAIGEMPWKEESFSIGDRTDTVKGDTLTIVVNGEEKKIYNNTKSSWRENLKTFGKVLGAPVNWEGVTYSNINAATGYSFVTDKSYYIHARDGKGTQNIRFEAVSNNKRKVATLLLRGNEETTNLSINTEIFNSHSQKSIERTDNKREINANEMNISSKQSLNLGVSRSTIRITNGNVAVAGSVDLGNPAPGIEVDDEERLAREEQEKLQQEREAAELESQLAAANAEGIGPGIQDPGPPVPIPNI